MPQTFVFEDNSPEVVEQIERGVQANLKAAAIIAHGAVIKELTGTRSGYEYPVPGTGRVVNAEKQLPNGRTFHFRRLEGATMYTASAPGEAPASVTGDLRTSYRFQVGKGEAVIGSPLEKAVWLERGTENMAPRPHLSTAFRKAGDRIRDALSRNVI